jgi:hypothetical protein
MSRTSTVPMHSRLASDSRALHRGIRERLVAGLEARVAVPVDVVGVADVGPVKAVAARVETRAADVLRRRSLHTS